MNKYIILSVLAFLITIQLNAQPSVDKNWNTSSFFIDNFTPTRSSWDNVNWMDKPYDNKWKAHLSGCVTHGTMSAWYIKRKIPFLIQLVPSDCVPNMPGD